MDSTTKTRVKTAVVASGVVFPILIWGGTKWIFLLVEVLLLLGFWELAAMMEPAKEKRLRLFLWNSILGVSAFLLMPFNHGALICLISCIAYLGSIEAFHAHRTGDHTHLKISDPGLSLCWLWLTLGMVGLFTIRLASQGYEWLWFLLFTVWLTDCGAYFCGRAWGKKKMAPTISPGKTWIGTFGGVATATLGGTTIGHLIGLPVSLPVLISLSLLLSVLAVIGDLFESLIKRAFGVKDSGTLLPGHGGILDRLDSILYASPVLACILTFMN